MAMTLFMVMVMSMSIYWFNPKCCMFLELSQEMLMK